MYSRVLLEAMKGALVLEVWLLLGCWEWSVLATETGKSGQRGEDYLQQRVERDQMILSFRSFVTREESRQEEGERIYPAYPQSAHPTFLILLMFSRLRDHSSPRDDSEPSDEEMEFGILFDGTQIFSSSIATKMRSSWQAIGSLSALPPRLADSSTSSCFSSSRPTQSHGPQIGWAADGKAIPCASD